MSTEVFAFEVWHKDRKEWARTVNERTASRARYDYFLDLHECYEDTKYVDIRSKKVGKPRANEGFERTAKYNCHPAYIEVIAEGEDGKP